MTQFQGTLPVVDDGDSCGVDFGRWVPVVEIYPATTPIEADLSVSSEGASPGVSLITPTSSTMIRVTFEAAAVGNTALSNPDNYVITPSLAVHSVAPEATTNPSYVDLVIDEQKDGESYTLELQRIERAA